MATQISLGSFGQIGGRNVVTGGSSGLDTKALIEGLTTAKRLPAVRIETTNKQIDSKTTAYNDLKSIFTKFQTAADTLRNPPGVDQASKNIFEYRSTSLVGSGGIVPSSYVEVAALPGAVAQNYTINSITQLAKATKQQSGDILIANSTTASAVTANGSPVAGLFRAGTVNLRAVDGTIGGIPLTLAQGDSLQTVANKFNELSSRTGIQATILNVSNGNYKLIFTATKTGSTYGFDLGLTSPAAGAGIASDPSGVLSQLAFATNQSAQNALFTVDGVPIQRESNAVADVVDNVTINLKDAPMVAGSITVSVKEDATLVANAINQLVDAYNEFRLFVSKQSQLDENNQPLDTAVLYNSNVFRSIINSVSDEVTRVVSGITGSNPSRLLDIGLKLENFEGDADNLATKNIITVDQDKLKSAIQSNFEGVRNLFEYRQTSDNTNFATFKRSNSLNGITGFTVLINRTDGSYKATYIDPVTHATSAAELDVTPLSTGGISLKGQAGTVFEGSEYVYAAAGDAIINVSLTQGFADRFYNAIDGFIKNNGGSVTQELGVLADTKSRNKDEIKSIDDKITKYRDQLVQQYSSLESAITKANQILQLLDAQSNARNNA